LKLLEKAVHKEKPPIRFRESGVVRGSRLLAQNLTVPRAIRAEGPIIIEVVEAVSSH
jgi:hypothetical protein